MATYDKQINYLYTKLGQAALGYIDPGVWETEDYCAYYNADNDFGFISKTAKLEPLRIDSVSLLKEYLIGAGINLEIEDVEIPDEAFEMILKC